MVATDHFAGDPLNSLRNRAGIGTISDHVAEAHSGIPLSRRGREGCIERGEIGVEVAEDQKSHSKVRKSAHEYSGTSSGVHQRITKQGIRTWQLQFRRGMLNKFSENSHAIAMLLPQGH